MYCHIQYMFHIIEDDRQGQRTNDDGTVMVVMLCTHGHICTVRTERRSVAIWSACSLPDVVM